MSIKNKITVEEIGQLFKIALTGDENLRKNAIKLLTLLPLYFGGIERSSMSNTEHSVETRATRLNAFKEENK